MSSEESDSPVAVEPPALVRERRSVIDRRTARAVQDWARAHLLADPHGSGAAGDQYHVLTLYFDTAARDSYHRRGSAARVSHRLRRYGHSDAVFLERRLQRGDAVMKRRIAIGIETIGCVRDEPYPQDWPGAWFARRLAVRSLGPVCQVTCRRTARVLMTDDRQHVRVTIDESLRGAAARVARFRADAGTPLLAGHAIVTVQFGSTLPAIVRQAMGRFGLVPATISRYRLGVAALDLSSVSRRDASAAEYTLLTS